MYLMIIEHSPQTFMRFNVPIRLLVFDLSKYILQPQNSWLCSIGERLILLLSPLGMINAINLTLSLDSHAIMLLVLL